MIKIAFFDVDGTLIKLGTKELSDKTEKALTKLRQNDIEMLEAVGTGVAMGNAKDEVKERADVVCKSVEEDGVYYYCLENKLITEVDEL